METVCADRKAVHDKNTIKSGDGKLIDKAILEFSVETAKRLVMGSTNVRLAACTVGTSKVSGWVGRSCRFTPPKELDLGKSPLTAIRIAVPAGRARPFADRSRHGEDLRAQRCKGSDMDMPEVDRRHRVSRPASPPVVTRTRV